MLSTVISSRQSVVCTASSKKPNNKTFEKSKKVFTDFHNKRSETFKLNSNDFVRVSQNEVTELNAFLKELDVFHKEQYEEIKKKVNEGLDSIKKQAEEKKADDENVVDVEVNEENIFLKKD
jgi:ElaB/YqjD/DUF883 family membrane-anchored ribosome-binding protein